MRGEKVDIHNTLDQHHKNLCHLQILGCKKKKNKKQKVILPVAGCQVSLSAWQPRPVRPCLTAPPPRLPRGWLV